MHVNVAKVRLELKIRLDTTAVYASHISLQYLVQQHKLCQALKLKQLLQFLLRKVVGQPSWLVRISASYKLNDLTA